MIRRIVAVLGAMRTVKADTVRAPSRARVSCGAFRAHCPIAAKDRAPHMTAEQAISSTLTNG
jgi:hypothetical protein